MKNHPHHQLASRRVLILLGLIFGVVTIGFSESAQLTIRELTGIFGTTHNYGVFAPYDTPGDDNAGKVNFDVDPGVGYNRAQLIGSTLSGYFWVDTVGWLYFNGTEITPSPSGNVRDLWTASGYAWSEQAGWIDFSTVKYDPNTLTLSGYAWSDTIGWVPIGAGTFGTGVITTNAGSGFIGRVKILGNLGSSNAYDVLYGLGNRYQAITTADYTNIIRKNVNIFSRNLQSNDYNVFPFVGPGVNAVNGVMLFWNTGTTNQILQYSDIRTAFELASNRTLVVVGADILIDTGVLLPVGTPPKGIIALKNDSGTGGNIYIHGRVTNIKASLLSEGSLFSGFKNNANNLETYNKDRLSAGGQLPNYQLYLRGSIVSQNTIGGSSFTGAYAKCPYIEQNCNFDTAIKYDFNYFRDYQDKVDPSRRGYPTNLYDGYSMVIEYDPGVFADPPPLFTY